MSSVKHSNQDNQQLIIMDGCGMLFRAYYGIPQFLAHDKTPVGAIYGFIRAFRSMLISLAGKDKFYGNGKLFVAVALDACKKQDNFRYKLYDKYKGNRKPIPHELLVQLQLAQSMLNALGITCLTDTSSEADDVIATYVKHAVDEKYKVTVVSNDKDLMQLVSDDVDFYDITRKKLCTEHDVYDKFGVAPYQIADYLSIVGDRADNIPGIRGLGAKTASELLRQFQTLDNIYENIHQITSPSIKELLQQGYDNAILSRDLIVLNDALRMYVPLDVMQWHGFEKHATTTKEFLVRYSLESLMRIVR